MSQEDITGKDRLQELIGADYRLQWIIGHGGMSTVWLADDVVNDREVAIKVLRPEFSDNQEFLTTVRFQTLLGILSASSSWNLSAVNRLRIF